MKDGFVADSSVGIAWAVLSQSSAATDGLLEQIAAGTPFVVPVLWTFELANALIVMLRRKRIDNNDHLRARRALSALTPVLDDEGPRLALDRIATLAEQHRLSVYDATYLELAIRRGLPLASRDADLNRAAKNYGVATLA